MNSIELNKRPQEKSPFSLEKRCFKKERLISIITTLSLVRFFVKLYLWVDFRRLRSREIRKKNQSQEKLVVNPLIKKESQENVMERLVGAKLSSLKSPTQELKGALQILAPQRVATNSLFHNDIVNCFILTHCRENDIIAPLSLITGGCESWDAIISSSVPHHGNLLLYPLTMNGHHTLVVVDRCKRSVEYFDSLGSQFIECEKLPISCLSKIQKVPLTKWCTK